MRRLAACLLLLLALLLANAEECSFPCSHGTCNEAERRCDCPPGVGGSACDVVVTPSCVLEPGNKRVTSPQAPPWESRSCACVTEWLELIASSPLPVAWSPEHSPGTVQCYEGVPGTALHTLWALAEAGAVNTSLVTISREPHVPEGRLTWSLAPHLSVGKDHAWEREPLGNCPYNCSLHGMCSRHDGGMLSGRERMLSNGTAEAPRCVCWGDRLGEGCERPHPAAPKDGGAYCLNNCRRVGTCTRGTCVCPPGTWGADCSTSRAPDGTLRLLRGFGPEHHSRPAQPGMPVFVYDLPPSVVSWQLWLARPGLSSDWGRTTGWRFLEAALRSAHRVPSPPPLDASNGTVFIVPLVGHGPVDRSRTFEYVRRAYPYLNASAQAIDQKGAPPNHVWPIMPGDVGLQQAIPEALGHLDVDKSGTKLPDLLRLNVFLTHQALHLGYTRNDATVQNARFWSPGVGATGHAVAHNKGLFVPGKDVFAAAADKQNDCLTAAKAAAQNRTHLFWWAGSLLRNDVNASSARATVVRLHSNATGFAVNAGHGLNDDQGMLSSRFCMAPSGVGGGYGSRDARALSHGCAPVYIQDYTSTPMDDLIPISLYGLHVPEADIPALPQLLAATRVDEEQVACTCRALHWPWVRIEDGLWSEMANGTVGGDALDAEGGWASLLMLLRRRAMRQGPLTNACDALPPSPPPPLGLAAQAAPPPPLAPTAQNASPRSASAPDAANDTCYGPDLAPLVRNIHEDLLPWALTGITADMLDAAEKMTMQAKGDAGLAFLVRAHKLYVIGASQGDFERVDGGVGPPRRSWLKWLMTYVQVLQRLMETTPVGGIPDVEFVLQQGDHGPGDWNLAAANNETRWKWGELRHLPLLRYCKSAETPEILIPYHHFWEHRMTATLLEGASYPPWAQRSNAVFSQHHAYDRLMNTATTVKRAADGGPFPSWARQSPREYLANTSAWATSDGVDGIVNTSDLRINVEHLPMADWSRYKYIAHVDGVACSSKLEQVLAVGSLVFLEQSGYRSFFHRLLRPFQHYVPFWTHRPQELLDALAWARANDEAAERIGHEAQAFARTFLNKHALSCYFRLLFREYARLQRFVPGQRLNESSLVPAADYIAWARRADNGTNRDFILDIELE